MSHTPTPPLEDRQTYMFTAVIDGVLPGDRLEYWAHSIEEAQAMAEAEYAPYGDRVRVEFHGIVPPGRDPYNIPGDSV
jgi:hypothetical protein